MKRRLLGFAIALATTAIFACGNAPQDDRTATTDEAVQTCTTPFTSWVCNWHDNGGGNGYWTCGCQSLTTATCAQPAPADACNEAAAPLVTGCTYGMHINIGSTWLCPQSATLPPGYHFATNTQFCSDCVGSLIEPRFDMYRFVVPNSSPSGGCGGPCGISGG
jgi:hypothetical protein